MGLPECIKNNETNSRCNPINSIRFLYNLYKNYIKIDSI